MTKDKTKICSICELGIIESKGFAEFTHHENKKKIRGKSFYHVECWRERISSMKGIKQLQMKTAQALNKVMGVVQ